LRYTIHSFKEGMYLALLKKTTATAKTAVKYQLLC